MIKTDSSVRYLGITAYDGAGFAGWQKQGHGERTVQGDLENALKKIFKGSVPTFGASRTDVGVHAEAQAFHFDAPFEKNPDSLLRALNANLQKDVVVKRVRLVRKGFHACYSAKAKMYEYHIYRHPVRPVANRDRQFWVPYELNTESMKKASGHFLGTHDFSALCPRSRLKENPERTVMTCSVLSSGSKIVLRVKGDGFMYHMVRIMAGTLLEVGAGKRKHSDIPSILESRNRQSAGVALPAHGLTLIRVYY